MSENRYCISLSDNMASRTGSPVWNNMAQMQKMEKNREIQKSEPERGRKEKREEVKERRGVFEGRERETRGVH